MEIHYLRVIHMKSKAPPVRELFFNPTPLVKSGVILPPKSEEILYSLADEFYTGCRVRDLPLYQTHLL